MSLCLSPKKFCIRIPQKVKWSCYRPGVAQRVGRGIALLFHDRGTRRGWVVSSTPRPHFNPGRDSVPILQEAMWAPGPVWTGGKSRPHRDSIPDRPARSQSLYQLSYPVHIRLHKYNEILRYLDVFSLLSKYPYTLRHTHTHKQVICVYVTLRGVRITIFTVEKQKCYIIWVCVCSLIYPACKRRGSYYVVTCGLSGCTIFSHVIS